MAIPVLIVFLLAASSGVYFFTHRTTGVAVPGAGPGVHVCSVTDYVARGVYCARADAKVSLNDGYLSFTGPHGNNFPATDVQLILSQVQADGTSSGVGQRHVTASLATNILAFHLKEIFSDMNVTPTQGSEYDLEVDSNTGSSQTLLGTTDFIIGPQQPTACKTGKFGMSVPYGWELQPACNSKGQMIAQTSDDKAGVVIDSYLNVGALASDQVNSLLPQAAKAFGTVNTEPTYGTTIIGGQPFSTLKVEVTAKVYGKTALYMAVGNHGNNRYLVVDIVVQSASDAGTRGKAATQAIGTIRFL